MSDDTKEKSKNDIVGWEVTVKRGEWFCTVTGSNPDICFEKCLESYDMDNFPDRDRYGSMN